MAEPYFGSSNSNGNMQMDYIILSLSVQFIIGGWLRQSAVHRPPGFGGT
jgi:hypothetical protein